MKENIITIRVEIIETKPENQKRKSMKIETALIKQISI